MFYLKLMFKIEFFFQSQMTFVKFRIQLCVVMHCERNNNVVVEIFYKENFYSFMKIKGYSENISFHV